MASLRLGRWWMVVLFLPGSLSAQVAGPEVVSDGAGLLVATTEVTQALYFAIEGENPSLNQGEDLPVDSVSWTQAVAFCNHLSQRDGLQPVYGPDLRADRTKDGWRLPSDEEWTMFARGVPSDQPLATSWFANNSDRRTHPVGQKAPQAGLFDLGGNVWEWCDSGDPQELQSDRGGGYRSNATLLGPPGRGTLGRGSWGDDLGFRVVRRKPDPGLSPSADPWP